MHAGREEYRSYDHLDPDEQTIMRAGWSQRIEQARRGLRMDQVLERQGRQIVELCAEGAVVVRDPGKATYFL